MIDANKALDTLLFGGGVPPEMIFLSTGENPNHPKRPYFDPKLFCHDESRKSVEMR